MSPPSTPSGAAALLRRWLPGQTWTQVRKLVAPRLVQINGELCLDPARRLKEGDPSRSWPARSHTAAHDRSSFAIMTNTSSSWRSRRDRTVRRPAERDWDETPQDAVADARGPGHAADRHPPGTQQPQRFGMVQRLDKETSGLVVFARTVPAERGSASSFTRTSRSPLPDAWWRAPCRRRRSAAPGARSRRRPAGQRRRRTRWARKPSRTSRSSKSCLDTPCCRAGWRRGERIRYASTWPNWAIRCAAKKSIACPFAQYVQRGPTPQRPASGLACGRTGLRSPGQRRDAALGNAPAAGLARVC